VTSSANPSALGQSVTFTATVTGTGGTPTGTVTFLDGGTSMGTGTLNGGVATFSTAALAVGNHTITTTYPGDGNFSASMGTLTGGQVVNKGATTTTLTSSQNPSTFGQAVTFTATITGSGGTATGTVTFLDGGTSIGTGTLSGGIATFTTSTLSVGNHTITTSYPGDGNFTASTGALANNPQVVNKGATTTTLTSSQNPSAFGQPVTFTATVSGSGGTPTGAVTFLDGGAAIGTGTLSGGVATFTTSALSAGNHTITTSYPGDANFGASTGALANNPQVVNKGATSTTLISSPNPSAFGQAVTFTATVTGGGSTPTGTVTFKDGASTIGTAKLNASGIATLTVSSLAIGTHSITASYGGDANFTASTSAVLLQAVSVPPDSIRLRQMQIAATPAIAQVSGQAISGAIDSAIAAGFGGNPKIMSPNGSGFTYYFGGDATPAQANESGDESLKRFLASPDGANARVDDSFRVLGYAGPVKARPPTPSLAQPRDWLAWVDFRGTDFYRGTVGDDMKGTQVNVTAGITHLITPNFLVGALGGYEHFDYSSQAFNGVLKGDGWTTGGYLGWLITPNLRFDASAAWSDILADNLSGTAIGKFTGSRWLTSGGLTGTYGWQRFVIEPSARVYTLWEHESAYTDSLGILQPARSFETGRASTGTKVAYPFLWSDGVKLTPYAGLFADYYFTGDNALTPGLTTVPLIEGWAARATGGVSATFLNGAQLGAGGEVSGLGNQTHIWTWTVRGKIPF
jgi:hypothetical protein